MKPAKLVVRTTVVLCLTLVVIAQPQKAPLSQDQQKADKDRVEAAHRELLTAKDKAAEASRLTQTVAPVLPGAAVSAAPIPRKNLVDEHIFGKIERDNRQPGFAPSTIKDV